MSRRMIIIFVIILLGLPSTIAVAQQAPVFPDRERNGREALHRAAENGNLDEVKRLFAAGTAIDLPDEEGATALLWAVRAGHEDVAAWLLEKGADPNIGNAPINKPLLYAIDARNIGLMERLLKCGANPNVKGHDGVGWSGLHGAVEQGWVDAVRLLLTHGDGREYDTGLAEAVLRNDLEMAKVFVNAFSAPDRPPHMGFSPLHTAAWLGNKKMAVFLIELGVNVNLPLRNGMTPLDAAVKHGDVDMIRFLQSKGGEVVTVSRARLANRLERASAPTE